MTFDPHATCFYTQTYWGARHETARSVAGRLATYLEKLSQIDETLANWVVGHDFTPYPSAGADLTSITEKDVVRDDFGIISENEGYRVLAVTVDERQIFGTAGQVGVDYTWPMSNRLDFNTTRGEEPNLAIVTYPLMKAAVLSLISCWEPSFCVLRSTKLWPDFDREGWFAKAWMTYVPPADASSVNLSNIPFVDTTANGGLLLSATTEVFEADNPAHFGGALRISQATRHLNATLPSLKRPKRPPPRDRGMMGL